MMEDVRKQDPTFTNFVPKTAAEAVDRYVRCRRNGLKPMLVPECLITCASGLRGPELDHFEEWIINPNGGLDHVKLVPDGGIRASNEALYKETCQRIWGDVLVAAKEPPLPALPEDDDEKIPALASSEAPGSTPST